MERKEMEREERGGSPGSTVQVCDDSQNLSAACGLLFALV